MEFLVFCDKYYYYLFVDGLNFNPEKIWEHRWKDYIFNDFLEEMEEAGVHWMNEDYSDEERFIKNHGADVLVLGTDMWDESEWLLWHPVEDLSGTPMKYCGWATLKDILKGKFY